LSDIRVDTISAANGTDPVTLTKQSAAKAYISYSVGSGATDSLNISSTVDENGTNVGQYLHNLTNAMVAANYNVVTSAVLTASDRFATASGVSTTNYTTYTWDLSANARIDNSRASVVNGDLA
jgi:hypothetical protein